LRKTSDIELISGLSQGDIESYEILFERYYSKIKGFAKGLTKDECAAEDIVANVFMKLWYNKEKLASLSNLSGYLFSVTKNEVIDHFRARKYLTDYLQSLENDYTEEAEPEELYDSNKIQEIVDRVVETMPEQRRKIFIMSRMENMSNGEIAEKLNISKRTVEKHISLALDQLRPALGKRALIILIASFLAP